MVTVSVRHASRAGRARLLAIALSGIFSVACASGPGPAELIGTWRVLRASTPVPDACAAATLTFRRDGSFEGSSGTLKTRGRYSATGAKNSYRLKLEQLEFSGAENCQGVPARELQANNVGVLDLAFEREGHDFRLSVPLPSDAYIVYTRAK